MKKVKRRKKRKSETCGDNSEKDKSEKTKES